MKRMIHGLLWAGALVACCAATVQVGQLATGRASPDVWNCGVTTMTALIGIGLTSRGFLLLRSTPAPADDSQTFAAADDHPALVAALDRLIAHFPDDAAAQEAVRVVARAVTERRYRAEHVES